MSTLFAIIVLIFSAYGILEFLRKVHKAFKNLKKGEKGNVRKDEEIP